MKAPLKHALPTITTTGRYILRNLNGPSPYTFIIGQLCRINRAGQIARFRHAHKDDGKTSR